MYWLSSRPNQYIDKSDEVDYLSPVSCTATLAGRVLPSLPIHESLEAKALHCQASASLISDTVDLHGERISLRSCHDECESSISLMTQSFASLTETAAPGQYEPLCCGETGSASSTSYVGHPVNFIINQ